MFFRIGFASKWNLMSSFGKVSQPICTEFLWASLSFVFLNLRYMEPDFQMLHISDPCFVIQMRFWAWWRVGMSENLPIYSEIWQCWTNYLWSRTKVDRIYLAVNMAVSLFLKCYKNIGILSKQIPTQNRIFVCIVLPIGITYWPLLFRCGITAPCSGVE